MVGVDSFQHAADVVSVEIFRYAEFCVDEEGLLEERDGSEQGRAYSSIII